MSRMRLYLLLSLVSTLNHGNLCAFDLVHKILPKEVSNNKHHCVVQIDDQTVAFVGGTRKAKTDKYERLTNYIEYNFITNIAKVVASTDNFHTLKRIGTACAQDNAGTLFSFGGARGFGNMTGWIKGLSNNFGIASNTNQKSIPLQDTSKAIQGGIAASKKGDDLFIWGGSDYHSNVFKGVAYLSRDSKNKEKWNDTQSQPPTSIENQARFDVALLHWEQSLNSSEEIFVAYGGDSSTSNRGLLSDLIVIQGSDHWEQYTSRNGVTNPSRRNAALIQSGKHLFVAGGETEDKAVHSAFRVSFDANMQPNDWQEIQLPQLSARYLGIHKANFMGQSVIFPSSGGNCVHQPLVFDRENKRFSTAIKVPPQQYLPVLWGQMQSSLSVLNTSPAADSDLLSRLKQQLKNDPYKSSTTLNMHKLKSYVYAFEKFTGYSANTLNPFYKSIDALAEDAHVLLQDLRINLQNSDEREKGNLFDLLRQIESKSHQMSRDQNTTFVRLKRSVYGKFLDERREK